MRRRNRKIALHRTRNRLLSGFPLSDDEWPVVQESTLCRICLAPTQKRKPYCLRHLDRLPYVARLQDTISRSRVPTRLMV